MNTKRETSLLKTGVSGEKLLTLPLGAPRTLHSIPPLPPTTGGPRVVASLPDSAEKYVSFFVLWRYPTINTQQSRGRGCGFVRLSS